MSRHIDSRLERLEREYDGDNDLIPGAPRVTWADFELLIGLQDALRRIEELEANVAKMDKALYAIGSNPALE